MSAHRRNLLLLCAAGLIGPLMGCQRTYVPPEGQVSGDRVIYDEAMELREWPRSTAYYASGNVTAGVTYFPFQYAGPRQLSVLGDPAFFLVNLAQFPVALVTNAPFRTVEYEGEPVEPTFTAVPPMPAGGPAIEQPPEPQVSPSEPPIEPDVPGDTDAQGALGAPIPAPGTLTDPGGELPTPPPAPTPTPAPTPAPIPVPEPLPEIEPEQPAVAPPTNRPAGRDVTARPIQRVTPVPVPPADLPADPQK